MKKKKYKKLMARLGPEEPPTWGKEIMGYSCPSPAQKALFKKRYPHL